MPPAGPATTDLLLNPAERSPARGGRAARAANTIPSTRIVRMLQAVCGNDYGFCRRRLAALNSRLPHRAEGLPVRDVLTVILAGGKGTRLEPLTRDRAKPAVPFGGLYRIIDFTLSNCINSGLRRVLVLTQYKARSLDRHIRQGWSFLEPRAGRVRRGAAAAAAIDEDWYKGTADAIYQNIYTLETEKKDADADPGRRPHLQDGLRRDDRRPTRTNQADLTIGCIPVPRSRDQALRHHRRRRRRPGHRLPGEAGRPPTRCPATRSTAWGRWASTSSTPNGCSSCCARTRPGGQRPRLRQEHHPGDDRDAPGVRLPLPRPKREADSSPYWRDVGTLDAYYQANMDLVDVDPVLNLYDQTGRSARSSRSCRRRSSFTSPPGRSARPAAARPSTAWSARAASSPAATCGAASCPPNVRVNSYAVVEDSILFDGVDVGRQGAGPPGDHRQGREVPERTAIGYDLDLDRRRGFTVTDRASSSSPREETTATFLEVRT